MLVRNRRINRMVYGSEFVLRKASVEKDRRQVLVLGNSGSTKHTVDDSEREAIVKIEEAGKRDTPYIFRLRRYQYTFGAVPYRIGAMKKGRL